MQRSQYRRLSAGLVLLIAVLGFSSIAATAQNTMSETVQVTTTHVQTHPSQGDVQMIDDGAARLVTSEDGVWVNMTTDELEDHHVYTLWFVVINNPGACDSRPCTAGYILSNPDEVQLNVTWAGGLLMSDEARTGFSAFFPVGEVPQGWFDNDLTNPLGAEIHLVINDHGPLIPEMAATMLNTYRGGCTDESLPPPFPDTAKADGEPGPNECRLIQVAIFEQ
jgi:hypothetical protein